MSVHTVPVRDERQHALTLDCWCDPRIEWLDPDTGLPWASSLGPLVHHTAADCRELAEELDGESMEPGKDWAILHDDGSEVER
jgi:hypothetical protein